MAIKKLYVQARRAKEALADLFPKPPIKMGISIGIALIVAIIVLASFQNLPKWIREVQAEWGKNADGQFILEGPSSCSRYLHIIKVICIGDGSSDDGFS